MAIVSRASFADIVERSRNAVNDSIAKGQLVCVEGNRHSLDTENPINAKYIRRWQYRNNVELLGETAAISPPTPARPERKAFQPRELQEKIERQNAKDQKKLDQDERKKELEMEHLQAKIQREQMLLDKAAGKLLPIDLVEGVLKRHGNAFLKNFEKGIENIANIFCNVMAGGDQRHYARIMDESRQVLAQCIQKAGADAEQEVDQLVEDFSEALLKGPRKL